MHSFALIVCGCHWVSGWVTVCLQILAPSGSLTASSSQEPWPGPRRRAWRAFALGLHANGSGSQVLQVACFLFHFPQMALSSERPRWRPGSRVRDGHWVRPATLSDAFDSDVSEHLFLLVILPGRHPFCKYFPEQRFVWVSCCCCCNEGPQARWLQQHRRVT